MLAVASHCWHKVESLTTAARNPPLRNASLVRMTAGTILEATRQDLERIGEGEAFDVSILDALTPEAIALLDSLAGEVNRLRPAR